MKLGHVAVYTRNMEKSVKFYELLGGRIKMESDMDCGNGRSEKLVHMTFGGEATVELVQPSHEDMLTESTGVCEHFCFDVDDVDKAIAELKAKGIDSFMSEETTTSDIFGGVKLIFLTGPSGEMIELLQMLH